MRTNIIQCDHCKAEISTQVDLSFFDFVLKPTSDIYLEAGSPDGKKQSRDFCNEACLRDFLIANLPAETTANNQQVPYKTQGNQRHPVLC